MISAWFIEDVLISNKKKDDLGTYGGKVVRTPRGVLDENVLS